MKKVLFLLLFLLVLGAANVSAQVRIGSDETPNEAAVLDLNADDDTNDGTKGLALPRVSLTDATIALPGTPTVNGMLVYNTNTSTSNGLSGMGIYCWEDTCWVRLQTMGLWTGTVTCDVCGPLAVGAYINIPFADFGAPAWAGSSSCWPSGEAGTQHYGLALGPNYLQATKKWSYSGGIRIRLFCWISLI